MAKTTKSKKTITRKRTVKKDINKDSDFFKFDDDYENVDYTDKYEATWNNDNKKTKKETITKETTYTVEDSGNDFFIAEESDNKDLLYKINKYARRVLKVVIVVAILIVLDLFLITRFEFGPLFAIRTKTYNDGGTKVYYGLGYKVIRYNVKDGREGVVVGNYNLKYNNNPKKIDLSNKKITEANNGDYVQIKGKVKEVDKKNKRIVLQKGKIKIYCDMKDIFKAYNDIRIDKNISIAGRIYVESNNKLYLENGVVK